MQSLHNAMIALCNDSTVYVLVGGVSTLTLGRAMMGAYSPQRWRWAGTVFDSRCVPRI